MTECKCGNPKYGFNCVCDWIEKHPGDNGYSCEFCGLYSASKPKCNRCECTLQYGLPNKQVVTVTFNNHDTDEDAGGIDILVDTGKTVVKEVRNQIAEFLEAVEGVEVQTVFN